MATPVLEEVMIRIIGRGYHVGSTRPKIGQGRLFER